MHVGDPYIPEFFNLLVHECWEGPYYCGCAVHTKWRLRHPETPVELSVSLSDSCGKSVCNKGSSTISYRADWCVKTIICSQINSSVGVLKKKKKKMEKIEV